MRSRRFELKEKDIPFLKRDSKIKIILTIAFAVTLAWQTIAFIMSFVNKTSSVLKICLSSLVILCSLMLLFVNISLIVRNSNLISVIKEKGHCLWDVPFISSTSKNGLLNIYKVICLALAGICGIILLASLICLFVQKSYIESTSYYLPLLFMICASCLNSYYFLVSNNYMQTLNSEQNIY